MDELRGRWRDVSALTPAGMCVGGKVKRAKDAGGGIPEVLWIKFAKHTVRMEDGRDKAHGWRSYRIV